MKKIRYLLLVTIVVIILVSFYSYSYFQERSSNRDILFQTSTINALIEGVYDGEVSFRGLREYGDFGIGTFNGLDGEMIGLDGKFYQVKVDGFAYPVNDSMKTPFAMVTYFESDNAVFINESLNYTQLELFLDDLLPTDNIFYAIKIEGDFEYIATRSVPKQNKPYSPLKIAIQNQSIFEFHDVKGTIVGFRCPNFMEGINVPGYHFHFITEGRGNGGHLLDCRIRNGMVEIDYTDAFYLVLLTSNDFYAVDLEEKKEEELEEIEK